MLRLARVAYERWAWVPCVLWLVSACQTNQDQLTITSVPLTSGNFKNLSWGGAQVERFHVVARKVENDEVVIWSPDRKRTCSLGPADWYQTVRPMRLGGLAWGALGKGLVPFIRTRGDDGRGTLQFSAVDCTVQTFEMDGITPHELFPTFDATRASPTYVGSTSDDRLAFLDPWSGERIVRGEQVSGIFPLVEDVWSIELVTEKDGSHAEAVLRDTKGAMLDHAGTDVTDLRVLGEGKIAIVDKNGLSMFSTAGGLEPPIASDACSPFSPSGFALGTLAYFSPCDSRRLVVRSSPHKVQILQSGIENIVSDSGSLIYTRMNSGQDELWVANEGDPRGGHLVATRPAFDLRDGWLRGPGQFLLWVADPADQGDNNDSFVLWELDAVKGTLDQWKDGLKTIRLEGTLFATLAADGTLELRRLRDLRPIDVRAGEHGAQAVTGVNTPPNFIFEDTAPALSYIANVDDATGTGDLELYFLDKAEHHTLAHEVREYQEVWWPENGIVFATGGAHPELVFERIDVPCDQSNSGVSALTCSF